MAGGLKDGKLQPIELQHTALGDANVRKRALRRCRSVDVGAGGEGEVAVSGDEVRVQMGLQYVRDAQAHLLGRREVLAHIALRIDDRARTRATQQIRAVGDPANEELSHKHGALLSPR